MRKEVDWHEACFIPELLYFENGNPFTGSVNSAGEKEFRYQLSPGAKPAEGPDSKPDKLIVAEVWYGPFCYAKSEIADKTSFAMNEQGRLDAIDWLASKYTEMIP